MPNPNKLDESELKFTKHQRSVEVPFVIYADFECILQDVETCFPQPSLSSTTNIQQHVPCAFAYIYSVHMIKV
ncbi:hypothetical protein NQ317_001535 [Molorchus minor]|uniref:Uncharacterized protein n=1 Tax=Molorchus minor TaxID=1323400 RepID=A0ABQ9JPG9_9CUCU|nr:hypothetical protein NQ317_001535 [Molorchus minor]